MDTSRSRRHHPPQQRSRFKDRRRPGVLLTKHRSHPASARACVLRAGRIRGDGPARTRALDRASSQVNRDLQHRFGSAAYAVEELRAELASAFVANEPGIPTSIPNHASYIEQWIKPLKDDKREIFRAAADAADRQHGTWLPS